jgi:hypothetical protein
VTRASYLLPIADREPLAWIIRERRTAFAEHRAREALDLEEDDVLFLYTTRGCFRNPTRDRGRVIGRARVKARAKRASRAPTFNGREYPYVVQLEIESLAPLREGLELAPIVPRLRATFPDAATWSVRMRRALVPLDAGDAAELERSLGEVVEPYPAALASYEGTAG